VTERLERLINLVIALREASRPLTAAEVHERVAGYGQDDHEAFRRMFERDKADLRALGVPVDTAPLDRWGDELGYRIDPERYDLPAVEFTPGELAALAVAVAATGLGELAEPGLRKLAVAAGQTPGSPADPHVALPLGTPHWIVLAEAQAARTTVTFDYQRPGDEARPRTVNPHALVHRRGHWYLVGHDHDRAASRAFRLDRIVGTVRTKGQAGAFEPPPEVRPDDVVPDPPPGPAFAEVAAGPGIAWQVARRARGVGRPAADGWVVFTVPVGDPDQFVSWALSHGPEIEVVEPTELRARIVDVLEQLAGEGP
jgi:predicted DNA-binding transcriptional regulator YafY